MSQDEVEQILPGWQAASQAVAQEMAEWRRAHPKATLTEIEAAVFEAMQKLQTRALEPREHSCRCSGAAAGGATHVSGLQCSAGATRPPAAEYSPSATTNAPRTKPQLRGVCRVWSRSFSPWMKSWNYCRVS